MRLLGLAFWHQFEGHPKPHLWFVLNEPEGYTLAVCLNMTSRHPVGERYFLLRAGVPFTTSGYSPAGDSTIFIIHPIALHRSRLEKLLETAPQEGYLLPEIQVELINALLAARDELSGNFLRTHGWLLDLIEKGSTSDSEAEP